MGLNPTARGKQGVKRSLLTEASGIPLAVTVGKGRAVDSSATAQTRQRVSASARRRAQAIASATGICGHCVCIAYWYSVASLAQGALWQPQFDSSLLSAVAPGWIFLRLWQAGLAEYDDMQGIAWQWQSIDGAMYKVPLALEKVGPNPTGRGKNGSRKNLLVDTCGIQL